MSTPRYLTLLGPTGAGKSTLGRALAAKLNLAFLSTGEALRQMATQNTPLGISIRERLAQGQYIPTPTLKKMITHALQTHPQGLVLDGFPRTVAQAIWLDKQVPAKAVTALKLEVSVDTILQRLKARGRNDDDPTLIEQRLGYYKRKAAPLMPYYKKSSRLKNLDANQQPEQVLATALQFLK